MRLDREAGRIRLQGVDRITFKELEWICSREPDRMCCSREVSRRGS